MIQQARYQKQAEDSYLLHSLHNEDILRKKSHQFDKCMEQMKTLKKILKKQLFIGLISIVSILLIVLFLSTSTYNKNIQLLKKQKQDFSKLFSDLKYQENAISKQLKNLKQKFQLFESQTQKKLLKKEESLQKEKIKQYIFKQLESQIKSISQKFNNMSTLIQEIDNSFEVVYKQHKKKTYQKRRQTVKSFSLYHYNQEQGALYKKLQKLNYDIPYENQLDKKKFKQQLDVIGQEEYNYYEQKYKFSQVKEQLSFCIIVPSWNNIAGLRYQLNLNSLLHQNYSNYKVHIIDDYSSDQTYFLIKRYLRRNNITQSKVTVKRNANRKYGLQNIMENAQQYCKSNQIISVIDGDDQLLGRNVLKLFNYFYIKENLGVAYTNWVGFNFKSNALARGVSQSYEKKQLEERDYRHRKYSVHSQMRTWKGELLFSIKQEDLKQDNKYFRYTYDQAIMFPMEQMAYQFTYVYNQGTNNNDNQLNIKGQIRLQELIKSKPRYQCHPNYV